MEYTKLTIKHFIADLPNIINRNFENVKNTFSKFLEEKDGTATVKSSDERILNGEFSVIKANSVKTNNLFIEVDGSYLTFDEYVNKLIDEKLNANS